MGEGISSPPFFYGFWKLSPLLRGECPLGRGRSKIIIHTPSVAVVSVCSSSL